MCLWGVENWVADYDGRGSVLTRWGVWCSLGAAVKLDRALPSGLCTEVMRLQWLEGALSGAVRNFRPLFLLWLWKAEVNHRRVNHCPYQTQDYIDSGGLACGLSQISVSSEMFLILKNSSLQRGYQSGKEETPIKHLVVQCEKWHFVENKTFQVLSKSQEVKWLTLL